MSQEARVLIIVETLSRGTRIFVITSRNCFSITPLKESIFGQPSPRQPPVSQDQYRERLLHQKD